MVCLPRLKPLVSHNITSGTNRAKHVLTNLRIEIHSCSRVPFRETYDPSSLFLTAQLYQHDSLTQQSIPASTTARNSQVKTNDLIINLKSFKSVLISTPSTSAKMAEHNYKFNISMSCGGCSGAIDRTLKKLENNGVKSYTVSLENQSAEVVTDDSLEYSTLLEKLKKTGKTVNSAEMDGTPLTV